MSGFISPKWAVKSRMDSRIFWVPSKVFCAWSEWPMGTDLCLGSLISFCSQKRKWPEPFSHGAAISFLPLFWLYFNERIYEYRDKVKWCCTLQFVVSYQWEKYRNLARSPQSSFEIVADFKEKCRFQTSILMEKCLRGLWFVGKSGTIHLKNVKFIAVN